MYRLQKNFRVVFIFTLLGLSGSMLGYAMTSEEEARALSNLLKKEMSFEEQIGYEIFHRNPKIIIEFIIYYFVQKKEHRTEAFAFEKAFDRAASIVANDKTISEDFGESLWRLYSDFSMNFISSKIIQIWLALIFSKDENVALELFEFIQTI